MAWVTGTSLSELLEKPFGPFLEEEALTEACRSTTEGNPVSLTAFLLECGGWSTGLDETERCQPDYDVDRFSNTEVRFHGVLEIKQLSWLTDEACNAIESELRERDIRARAANGMRATASNLSLRRIYAPTPGFSGAQLKVKVKIQGTKHMPAVYLYGRPVPTGLMIQSKAKTRDGYRLYAVETMHIHTFRRSKLFLARYRVMRTLIDLLRLDGSCTHHGDNKTPLHLRTPAWFVDLYMKYMAYAGEQRKWRPVCDPDYDPNIIGPSGKMKEKAEHTLRHVSRAEVYSLFAEHAQWIVSEAAAMRQRWLDLDSWRAWLVDVQRARRLAAREGVRWGLAPGVELPPDEDEDDEDDLVSALQSGLAQKGKKTKQRRAPRRNASRASGATSSTLRSADPPSHGPSRVRTPSPYIDDTALRTYDPDFSPVSTPPGSPSSSSSGGLPSRPASPIDPTLAALVPSAFLHPPQPTATLKWVCELEGCGRVIDLLRLTDADFALAGGRIGEDERRRLRGKSWSVRDVWARDAFGYMVSGHREQHLAERGVKIVVQGKEAKIVWTHPDGTHIRSDQLRKVKKDNRRPVIKEEDR